MVLCAIVWVMCNIWVKVKGIPRTLVSRFSNEARKTKPEMDMLRRHQHGKSKIGHQHVEEM